MGGEGGHRRDLWALEIRAEHAFVLTVCALVLINMDSKPKDIRGNEEV